jgi:hypothetical protein
MRAFKYFTSLYAQTEPLKISFVPGDYQTKVVVKAIGPLGNLGSKGILLRVFL